MPIAQLSVSPAPGCTAEANLGRWRHWRPDFHRCPAIDLCRPTSEIANNYPFCLFSMVCRAESQKVFESTSFPKWTKFRRLEMSTFSDAGSLELKKDIHGRKISEYVKIHHPLEREI